METASHRGPEQRLLQAGWGRVLSLPTPPSSVPGLRTLCSGPLPALPCVWADSQGPAPGNRESLSPEQKERERTVIPRLE